MPKGRIGLSLSEDVLAILNEYGRSGVPPPWTTADALTASVKDARPTRTEIIEEAVRLWERAKEIGNVVDEPNPDDDSPLSLPLNAASVDMLNSIINARINEADLLREFDEESQHFLNSLSPEAVQARTEKKAARKERKAALQGGVKEAIVERGPLDVIREDTRTAIDLAKTREIRERPLKQMETDSLLREVVEAAKSGGRERKAKLQMRELTPVVVSGPGGVMVCGHPASSRTTGKNWKCTACGYQHAAVSV